MEVQKDFKEFLALLNEHKVEFIIVGGYALAFHGATRFTGDIDVLIKSDEEKGLFGDVSVSYTGKKQFIKNKRASCRLKDLADLESTEEE
jgi:hypothetical protein